MLVPLYLQDLQYLCCFAFETLTSGQYPQYHFACLAASGGMSMLKEHLALFKLRMSLWRILLEAQYFLLYIFYLFICSCLQLFFSFTLFTPFLYLEYSFLCDNPVFL